MKKYSKLITIILCLAIIFTMFSGFTMSTNAINIVPIKTELSDTTVKLNESIEMEFECIPLTETDNLRYTWYYRKIGDENWRGLHTKGTTQNFLKTDGTSFISQVGEYEVQAECSAMDSIGRYSRIARLTVVVNEAIVPKDEVSVKVYEYDDLTLTPLLNYKSQVGNKITLPTSTPTRDGYLFVSWVVFYNDTNFSFVDNETVITEDMVVENQIFVCGFWTTEDTDVPTPENSQKIEISAYNSKEILNNKTKFLFSLNVRDNITLGELKEEYLNDNLPKYNNFAIKTFLSSTYFTIIDDDFVIKKDALLDDYEGFVLFIGVDDIDKIDGNVSEDGSGGEIVQAEYVTVTYMDNSKIYKTTKVISSKINETQYLINPPFSLDGSKTFKGWGMSASAKNVITADWKPTEDTILYSIYEIKDNGVESFGKKVIGILIVAGVIVLLVVIIKTVNSGFVNNAYKGGKSRLEYKEYKKNTKKNKK